MFRRAWRGWKSCRNHNPSTNTALSVGIQFDHALVPINPEKGCRCPALSGFLYCRVGRCRDVVQHQFYTCHELAPLKSASKADVEVPGATEEFQEILKQRDHLLACHGVSFETAGWFADRG